MAENNFPQGTEDLYAHLQLDHSHHDENSLHSEAADVAHKEPEAYIEPVTHTEPEPDKQLVEHDKQSNVVTLRLSSLSFGKIFKNGLPYAIIFAFFIFAYMVLFTNFSVRAMFANLTPKTSTQQVVTKIPADQQDAYNKWIASYFFEVNDPKIIDPDTDLSGNGLTNYQKFLLGLNPKKKDTLGLGMTDTQALVAGIDPLTGGSLTQSQKDIISKYIDLEGISNKLSLESSIGIPKVAAASTDFNRDVVGIDQNVPGTLNIPSINVTAPVIWSKDVNSLMSDLENGLVHYPGTAMPSELGTAYISGHSSNYVWDKGRYNEVLAHLGDMKEYDSFSLTVQDTSGKKVILHYVVSGSGIFKANDQAQFANNGKSEVALSTCWPVGTSAKRLVVFGTLTQIER